MEHARINVNVLIYKVKIYWPEVLVSVENWKSLSSHLSPDSW